MKEVTPWLFDHCGKASASRIHTLIVLLAVLFMLVYAAVTGRELPAMPPEYVALILGPMGIQVWSKGKEKPPEAPTP